MSFILTASNYELEKSTKPKYHDHTLPPSIKFVCLLDDVKLFEMIPESGALAEEWRDLELACTQGGTACVEYDTSNGECSIFVKDRWVEFQVSKFGDGQGGSLEIRIPAIGCTQAFKDAARITEEWLSHK